MKLRRLLSAVAVAALSFNNAAFAGGAFSSYPIVGNPANTTCLQYGNNGVCNQYSPAGPSGTTGNELLPADTGAANGANPQTELIPLSMFGGPPQINQLIGGDFAINLWQRGTTPLSAGTPSSATMTADRWYAYSSGNTVTVSKQTGASDILPTLGLYASMRVSRPSGTNNTQICVGQVLDKNASRNLIGNNGVLSFYALAGAGLSAVATNQLQVNVAYYTAADSATPGTNTGTFASGSITGYTAAVAGPSNGTTATVASGVATVPISTTWTRYAVYAPIPTANASGTAVTGVGVSICYTPASGTGGSTEWFEIEGVQLQAQPSTTSNLLPNGVTSPTAFEKRSPQWEADYQYWYSQVLTDGAATTVYPGFCSEITANTTGKCTLFLQPMREVPSTTVGTATSFSMRTAADAANACTTLTAVASSNTTTSAGLQCAASGTVAAGVASPFVGANTGGLLTFSAEP